MTCSRCVGTWVAAGLASTQILAPRFGRLLTWSLAAAGVERLPAGRLRGADGEVERARAAGRDHVNDRAGGYPGAVRRVVLVFAAAFVCAAPAHAASLSVAPHDFSPHHATLQVSAKLGVQRQVGVSLVTPAAAASGGSSHRPARTTLAVGWNGLIDGKLVPDGTYVVKLVYRSSILATTTLHIDTQAPQLLLHATNGASQFAGDNQLLTTISPNGDGFRDRANVTFRLREPATVTMDVTRTVKVPNTIYTLTSTLAAGVHTLTWAPAPTTNPRTFLVRVTAVDRARQPRRLRRRRTRSSAALRKASSCACRGSTRASASRATRRARWRASTSPPTQPSLSMRIFRSGPEQVVTYADNQMAGVDIGTPPTPIDWSQHRSEPRLDLVPHSERAQRPLLRPVRRGGRPGRLRAVRRAPGGARGDRPRARHPADEHLAGLQLPGRRRQRLRRHVVRRAAEPRRRPRRARTSRAASRRASTATTCRSCTGCSGPARAPSSSPTPTSTRSRTATTSRARTTWSSSRDTRST